MANVVILLTSYNGSKYIAEMIESILGQDYTDWKLVLSDDGSKDGTGDLLEDYARRFPDKILHYRSGRRFGNAQDHFMHLLQRFQDAPYIMFCDQDDVWHEDKIRKTLEKMREIEKGPGVPAMVHTDLRVVDGQLNVLDSSFMHFSNLKGDRLALKQLLVQNVVTGCTMMINRSLGELACKHLPEGGILMHDWWLALLASACGTVGFLDQATIDYRQHGGNVVGAKNSRSLSYISSRLKKGSEAMRKTFQQAKAFYGCFGADMDEETASLVAAYGALADANGLARRLAYLRYGFLKIGAGRILGQLLLG